MQYFFLIVSGLFFLGGVLCAFFGGEDRGAGVLFTWSIGAVFMALFFHSRSEAKKRSEMRSIVKNTGSIVKNTDRISIVELQNPTSVGYESKLRIASGGEDLGEISVVTVKLMIKTGKLTHQDYYYDSESKEWVQLEGCPELVWLVHKTSFDELYSNVTSLSKNWQSSEGSYGGVMSLTCTVILKKSEEGYAVGCPVLPGCWSQGSTESEALENIREAIGEYLSVLQEKGFWSFLWKKSFGAIFWTFLASALLPFTFLPRLLPEGFYHCGGAAVESVLAGAWKFE